MLVCLWALLAAVALCSCSTGGNRSLTGSNNGITSGGGTTGGGETTSGSSPTWYVGPTRTYRTPCQLAYSGKLQHGDTIYIDYSPSNAPSVGYYDDTCAWTTDDLTLIGVPDANGNRPVLNTAGTYPANYKGIWDIQGNNYTVENMEFENAAIPSAQGANGAGIRMEGSNLTVYNCYFHNNQMGLLESNVAGSNITIEYSEFYNNGVNVPAFSGDDWGHNLYIGHCASLTFEYNYSHGLNMGMNSSLSGHLLKTRAGVNYILYNRITDEAGTASYEIDIPNGGTSYVIGNEVEKGPNAQNSTALLGYLEEGTNPANPGQDLYVVNNTFVNDEIGHNPYFVRDVSTSTGALIENNILYGPGTATNQTIATQTTNYAIQDNPSMFVNISGYNYDLSSTAGSPPVDAGTTPGSSAEGYSLTPIYQYVQDTDAAGGYVECSQPRTTVNTIDIGAYEYQGGGSVTCRAGM